MGRLLHNMDIQLCCFLAGIYYVLYVCICLVARINQRIFRNSSLQCFLCACVANDACREATSGPPQELAAKRLVRNNK